MNAKCLNPPWPKAKDESPARPAQPRSWEFHGRRWTQKSPGSELTSAASSWHRSVNSLKDKKTGFAAPRVGLHGYFAPDFFQPTLLSPAIAAWDCSLLRPGGFFLMPRQF